MKKQMQLVRCTVNGREVEEYVDVRESLLDMLRNRLGLTSVKKGCEVGECGACTVIIDGETIDSCIYLAVWAEGKNIRTLEGLEKNGELTRIQEAFIEEGAIQCGFCTPGFIMSATVLLEHGEKLSRDAIRKHMAGNLCRCTGYENIVNAVEKVMDENETRRGKTVSTGISKASQNFTKSAAFLAPLAEMLPSNVSVFLPSASYTSLLFATAPTVAPFSLINPTATLLP